MGRFDWQMLSVCNVAYYMILAGGIFLYAGYRRKIQSEQLEVVKLEQFLHFLDQVSYQYSISQCVEEAVLEALESVDTIIADTVDDFYQILIADEMEELMNYPKDCHTKYYFHFLMYSFLVMEYGDSINQSAFLRNVSFLKKQVFIWILNQNKLKHCLWGLVGLVLIPIQFLRVIEIWANWNLQELNKYYSGTYGIITRFLLVFVTLLCYQSIVWLYSIQDTRFYESNILRKIKRSEVIQKYYHWWIERHPDKVRELSILLRKSSSRLELLEFWLLRRILGVIGGFVSVVMLSPIIRIQRVMVMMVLAFSILSAAFLYWAPVWFLRIRIILMKKQKEDEVYFFYGIVFQIVLSGNGDVESILEWILVAADIMEPAVQTCLDEYSYDSEAAITKGKEMEPFAPFLKLLDAFLVSERIGLKQAVNPLFMELNQFLEKRRQDNEIITENKRVIGAFIGFIPMICIVILYLIVPFVLESLYQLQEYIKQIQIGF